MPAALEGPPTGLHAAVYSSFCDTVLRGFKGSQLLRSRDTVGHAYQSEAEQYVQSAFSLQADELRLPKAASANATLTSYNDTDARMRKGVAHLIGSALSSCVSRLYSALLLKVDARPRSFILEDAAEGTANGMVLLSGGDRNAALSERVVANHAAFARRHGYVYWWHRGSMVAELGWLPYWHKIAHLRAAMARFPNATAYAWVDEDIILTNHLGGDRLRGALRRSNASVLVTADPAAASGVAMINTGILIVRNVESAREVLQEVWRRATAVRADGLTLATDPQSDGCLHEQQALQEMLYYCHSCGWRDRVGVLEQRGTSSADNTATAAAAEEYGAASAGASPIAVAVGDHHVGDDAWNLNTFLRWSHYNAERAEQMRFDADASGSGWRPGDFAGHCSGLSAMRRALCIAGLLSATVE